VVTTVAVLSLGPASSQHGRVLALQRILRLLPVAARMVGQHVVARPQSRSTSCGNAGGCDAVFSYAMYLDLARDQTAPPVSPRTIFSANVGYRNDTQTADGMEGLAAPGLLVWRRQLAAIAPADTAQSAVRRSCCPMTIGCRDSRATCRSSARRSSSTVRCCP
jgi:hypothetical protein